MDKDIIQQGDILQLIGQLRTPIQKASKIKKQQIKDWIAGSEQLGVSAKSELLLRAYLSIGENPIPQTLQASTIVGALEPGDILRHAKKLCLSSRTIEATALFEGLQTALQNSAAPQAPFRLIRKIVPGARKWLKWVDSIHGNLTEETEVALLNLFTFLLHIAAPSKKLSDKKLGRVEKMIIPLLELSLGLAAKSLFHETLTRAMELFGIIGEKFSSTLLESILEDDKQHQLLEQALERIPIYVRKSAHEGRVDRIEAMATAVRCIHGADSGFQAALREIWDEGPGVLTVEVQRFIQGYLKMDQGITPRAITLVDHSEGLHIPQLATALLRSWEVREESPRAAEAFQILHTVVQKFFNMRLCGQVGNVVAFDPKVHEFPGTPIGQGQVVIVRPWVVWTKGSRSKVIMRAIVEQAKQD